MSCNHHHIKPDNEKKLFITIFLNLFITISQFIGGVLSGSLALISDALHNFSDVISLIISYIAERLTKKDFTESHTFGFKRAEILAALINSLTLVFVSVFLMYHAVESFFTPRDIIAEYVIVLAFVSILFNGLSVLILFKEAKNSLNIRASYLHLLSDMITSVAVLIGGILIYLYNITWVDSVLTIFIGVYLLKEAVSVLKETVLILMNFSPSNINLNEVENRVKELENVKNLHHIHIWSLTDHEVYFQAHLDLEKDMLLSEVDSLIYNIDSILKKEFGINHTILQPEYNYEDDKNLITAEINH